MDQENIILNIYQKSATDLSQPNVKKGYVPNYRNNLIKTALANRGIKYAYKKGFGFLAKTSINNSSKYLQIICIVFISCVSLPVLGVVTPPNFGSTTDHSTKDLGDQETAKVRIPVKITTYEKMIIKKTNGQSRIEHKKSQSIRYVFRGRMERSNHFYVSRWHIETVPLSWEKRSNKYKTKLRFYKSYGETPELEEYLGHMTITGSLEGEDKLYNLVGFSSAKFTDKHNNPVIDVEIGKSKDTDKSPLISRDTDKKLL